MRAPSFNAWIMGRADEARVRMRRAAAAIEDDAFASLVVQWNSSFLHVMLREPEQAAMLAGQAIETAGEHGFRQFGLGPRMSHGWVQAQLGHPDEGARLIREALTAYRAKRLPGQCPNAPDPRRRPPVIVGGVCRRPGDARRVAEPVPDWRRLLTRVHHDRHVIEIAEFAVEGQPVFDATTADHLEGLVKLSRAGMEIDTAKTDLNPRNAAADPEKKTAAAHLVEHANLVDQPQRMIKRQQINHHTETQPPTANASRRRQKDRGGRRIAERRVYVLGQW